MKTLSGSPRARMLVSWICLRTIQASSCLPIYGAREEGYDCTCKDTPFPFDTISLSALARKFVSYLKQVCVPNVGHYFAFARLRSLPTSSLLLRTASHSFRLVHCWQINKNFFKSETPQGRKAHPHTCSTLSFDIHVYPLVWSGLLLFKSVVVK